MKPFITDAYQGGKYVLPFQVEGFPAGDVSLPFKNALVSAYGLPATHTLKEAWSFRLVLDTGWIVDFSSACTGIGGWHEMGSLNLSFSPYPPAEDSVLWQMNPLPNFRVNVAERLTYADADVYAECGLVLGDSMQREIVVAAGVSPGSVTIALPSSTDMFDPELAMDKLQRRPL